MRGARWASPENSPSPQGERKHHVRLPLGPARRPLVTTLQLARTRAHTLAAPCRTDPTMELRRVTCALALALGCTLTSAAALLGPGVISTGLQETSASLSPDGGTVYFMRSDFGEKDDTILVSYQRNGRWSAPEVTGFSGQWHDSEPTFSPDGRRLYFVSNRPPRPGAAPVEASMNGHHFAGTQLWYVERQADGRRGAPVHVEGELNDGAMIYNPSVAANGDIYFSAPRADSGKAYQNYVARRTAHRPASPQRVAQ